MNDGIVTQKSYVNTWECDENAHLNVQFYWKRFGDAGHILASKNGHKFKSWTDRHVRYHSELLSGAITSVQSDSQHEGDTVVHLMTNGSNGTLSATAIDRVVGSLSGALENFPEAARPRSISFAPLAEVNREEVLEKARGIVSHISVIAPSECDASGLLLDQYHISRFSEAASQFWENLDIGIRWLLEQNLGSVAVEMKATRHNMARVGMQTEIVTWLGEVREKTFTFHHQVRDLISGTVLYSGAVTALLIDLTARKTVPLPDSIQRLIR